MIAFIDDHRPVYGVEPTPCRSTGQVCRVLPIAPSTYREHAARRRNPARLPARARRDEILRTEIGRVWEENFRVYGVRKVWRQLRREGIAAARCTTARLMRQMGLSGAMRGKTVKATLSNPASPCPRDKSLPRRRPG
jgi:putative transposase